MKHVNNERGVALVTALMLTMLSLVICASLLYMITHSTRTSASQKRYSNAIAAGYGTAEMVKEIVPRMMSYTSARSCIPSMMTGFSNVNLAFPTNSADIACLDQKLKNSTSDWSSDCTAENRDNRARIRPDFSLMLNGSTPGTKFKTVAKIVNTVRGNSDTSGVDFLEQGLSVSQAGGGVIAPQHFPSMFTVEVSAEQEVGATERAELSVLYAY
jgi:hypothetical protein